jgi:hypothetical protein
VRSALGCKCSISVTQGDRNSYKGRRVERFFFFFSSLAKRGERGQGNGVYERFAYLFATRYQSLYQHRLSLLRVVQLLSELLVLVKENHDGRKFLLLNVFTPKENPPERGNRDDNDDKPRTYLFLDLLRAYFFSLRELLLFRGSRAG